MSVSQDIKTNFPNLIKLVSDYYNDPAAEIYHRAVDENFREYQYKKEVKLACDQPFDVTLYQRLKVIISNESIMGESRIPSALSYLFKYGMDDASEHKKRDIENRIPTLCEKMNDPQHPWKEINLWSNDLNAANIPEDYLKI